MSTQLTEYRYLVCRPDGYGIHANATRDGEPWFDGNVRTRHGYVRVYSEQGHTSLSIIHQGYDVSRVIRRSYTPRGLVTLTDRFAREVCE